MLLTDAYGGIESAHPAVFVGLALLASAYVVCSIVRTASTRRTSILPTSGRACRTPSGVSSSRRRTERHHEPLDRVSAHSVSRRRRSHPSTIRNPVPTRGADGRLHAVAVVAPAALFRAGPRTMLAIGLLVVSYAARNSTPVSRSQELQPFRSAQGDDFRS